MNGSVLFLCTLITGMAAILLFQHVVMFNKTWHPVVTASPDSAIQHVFVLFFAFFAIQLWWKTNFLKRWHKRKHILRVPADSVSAPSCRQLLRSFIMYSSLKNHVLNQFTNTYKMHKVNMPLHHTQVIMLVLKKYCAYAFVTSPFRLIMTILPQSKCCPFCH